jgi:hypothetical protein
MKGTHVLLLRLMIVVTTLFAPQGAVVGEVVDVGEGLKCSPPVPRNISLTIDVQVDGGGLPFAGASGSIVFTIRNLEQDGGLEPALISHFPRHGLPLTPMQPLWLMPAIGDACVFTEHVQAIDGEPQMFYTIHAAGAPPLESSSCALSFQVGDSVEALPIEWIAAPSRMCVADPDRSDNHAIVVFGNLNGLPTARAVPARGESAVALGVWMIALLAICVSARRVLRT